jgi:hypothetical protein
VRYEALSSGSNNFRKILQLPALARRRRQAVSPKVGQLLTDKMSSHPRRQ